MKNKLISRENPSLISKNFGTLVILGLALFSMVFFGVCNPRSQQNSLGGTAATVNGDRITKTEFGRAYNDFRQRMRQQYGENFDPQALRIASTVLNRLVMDRVVYFKAQSLGVSASRQSVVDQLATVPIFKDEQGKFSPKLFKEFLRNYDYTEASFFSEQQRRLSKAGLNELVTRTLYIPEQELKLEQVVNDTRFDLNYVKIDPSSMKTQVTESEKQEFLAANGAESRLKSYYNAHKKDYNKPGKVKARQIVVAYKGARGADVSVVRNKAAAKKRATELYKKATASSANFEALAKKNTDEPGGKANGGLLDYFTFASQVKPLSEKAFGLKKGEIGSVVETDFGFHIVKSIDRKKEVNISFDAAKNEIMDKLIIKKKGPKQARVIADKLLALVKSGEALEAADLKPHGLEWQSTGDFSVESRYISGLGSVNSFQDALFELKEKGQVLSRIISVKDTHYIVGLKNVSVAKIDGEEGKHQRMRAALTFYLGRDLLASFEEQARKEYEAAEEVYLNPQFLAIDQPQNQNT